MENLKILVPLDFSDISIQALHSAQTFAAMFGGTITPFHSYVSINEMDSTYSLGMSAGPMENYEELEEALLKRLKETSEEEIESRYLEKPKITIGNPAQAIVEEAKEFDMIVMSTHGRTGFTRFFLGSVSEKVLRISHVPVLIVNKDRELTEIDRIMLTTDFSDHSREAFPMAKEIAQKSGAKVELIHIMSIDPHDEKNPDESVVSLREQRLNVLAKEDLHQLGDQLETKVIVSTDTPHEALLNYNLNNPHDLIVISAVGRTGIDYLMMGSTTANIVRNVKSPVLSVNPKRENQHSDA